MATRRKVGRKLANEFWSPKVLKEVSQWFNLSREKRQEIFGIRTDEEFATRHGMHRNTLYNLRQKAVNGILRGSPFEADPPRQKGKSLSNKSTKTLAIQPTAPPIQEELRATTPLAAPTGQAPWWLRTHWRSEEEINASALTSDQRYDALMEFRKHPEWAKEAEADPYGHGKNCDCTSCRFHRVIMKAKEPKQ